MSSRTKDKANPRHVIDFRNLRQERGLTQKQCAEALGVAQHTIVYWDRGRLPSTEYLPDIARLFGVTIEELYGLPRP